MHLTKKKKMETIFLYDTEAHRFEIIFSVVYTLNIKLSDVIQILLCYETSNFL